MHDRHKRPIISAQPGPMAHQTNRKKNRKIRKIGKTTETSEPQRRQIRKIGKVIGQFVRWLVEDTVVGSVPGVSRAKQSDLNIRLFVIRLCILFIVISTCVLKTYYYAYFCDYACCYATY